ncbi:MAG: ankyrin repeat domain-containing protein [Alphaproteobacteria bacterium]|nr:ankyrin repeat domain-containing protein [Alphaproteobacteria bacterium]
MTESLLTIWAADREVLPDKIRELLAQGCDINEVAIDGQTPLIKASYYSNSIEVLQIMLDAGANISARDDMGRTVLFGAVLANKINNVRFFIQNRASVNARLLENGLTPLLVACEAASLEIVKALIDAGAGINTKDSHGYSPIMVAIQANREDVVQELLNHGARVDRELVSFVESFADFSKTEVGQKIKDSCYN